MNDITQLTLRLPAESHTKIRVISAYKNVSVNAMVAKAVQDLITQWEQKYGTVVIPEE